VEDEVRVGALDRQGAVGRERPQRALDEEVAALVEAEALKVDSRRR
jgi:hypothetical protein